MALERLAVTPVAPYHSFYLLVGIGFWGLTYYTKRREGTHKIVLVIRLLQR